MCCSVGLDLLLRSVSYCRIQSYFTWTTVGHKLLHFWNDLKKYSFLLTWLLHFRFIGLQFGIFFQNQWVYKLLQTFWMWLIRLLSFLVFVCLFVKNLVTKRANVFTDSHKRQITTSPLTSGDRKGKGNGGRQQGKLKYRFPKVTRLVLKGKKITPGYQNDRW